jgi:hypothetical protein
LTQNSLEKSTFDFGIWDWTLYFELNFANQRDEANQNNMGFNSCVGSFDTARIQYNLDHNTLHWIHGWISGWKNYPWNLLNHYEFL